MTEKLKEKMINNRDPITAVIMSANNDMGNPIIIARFLMFLYILNVFIDEFLLQDVT